MNSTHSSPRTRLLSLSFVVVLAALGFTGAMQPVKAHATAAVGGAYVALAPTRIMDTRTGKGDVPPRPLGTDGTLNFTVWNQGGVPNTATAVVLNATVTDTTASVAGNRSYLTIFPTGAAKPTASNLNWYAGQTVANLVEVGLGANGQITIFNAQGNVDVILDVAGYVANGLPVGQGLYKPLVPARILDTRDGTGTTSAAPIPAAPIDPGRSLTLQVTGQGGVPQEPGVAGVVLNVTVTNPAAGGFLTVYPTDQSQPLVSNLNFYAGQTVPNRVIVKVSASSGQVSFFNGAAGTVHVVADVGGWFTDGSSSGATGSVYTPVTPARILDTRDSGYLLGAGRTMPVQVAGHGGVPAMNDLTSPPNAVVANVTVTNDTITTASSFLTVWPDGDGQPGSSDLNWIPYQTVPNLVVVKLGSTGAIDAFNAAGCVSVIVDVVGYYTGPALPNSGTATGVPNCPKPDNNCGAPGNPFGFNFCDYYAGNYIYNPPGNFCTYFACIASFWTSTNGYVEECADGWYSHSGGVRGSCSSGHLGNLRALFSR